MRDELKIQFINKFPSNLREVLVCNDGILIKYLKQIVKIVARVEAERGGRVQLISEALGMTEAMQVDVATATSKNRRRAKPKVYDTCTKCGGKDSGQGFVHQKLQPKKQRPSCFH